MTRGALVLTLTVIHLLAGFPVHAQAPLATQAPSPDPVIAQSGNQTLTAGALRNLLAASDPQLRAQAGQDPAVLARLARTQMLQMLLLDEARDKHWDQRPDVAFRAELARQAVIVNLYLASLAAAPPDYPAEPEILAAYEANKKSFLVPRQYHLAQIFIALPADAARPVEEPARQKLREVEALLANTPAKSATKSATKPGADFGAVARRLSDDAATAAKDGDLGWLREDQLVPGVRDAVAGLPNDAISEPIRVADGWHILRLLETRPASPAPLAEIREQLVRGLRQQRAAQNERALTEDLLRRRPIQLDEIGLQRAVQP